MKTLRQHRRERFISQQTLATESGVRIETLWSWERGKHRPVRLALVKAVCDVLHVAPHDVTEFHTMMES